LTPQSRPRSRPAARPSTRTTFDDTIRTVERRGRNASQPMAPDAQMSQTSSPRGERLHATRSRRWQFESGSTASVGSAASR
jgi:hypothetical protein